MRSHHIEGILAFILSMAVPLWTANTEADARVVRSFGADDGEITLEWDHPIVVEEERNGRELVLRFSRPLGALPLTAIQREAGDFVSSIRQGYDSVLVVMKPGAIAETVSSEKGVSLLVRHAERRGAVVEDSARAAYNPEALSLSLAKVRLALEDGRTKDAFAILDSLERDFGTAPSYLATRAAAEQQAGRRYRAHSLLKRASKSSLDENLERSVIRQEPGIVPAFSLETDYRHAGSQWSQWTQRASFEAALGRGDVPEFLVGGKAELNRFRFDDVREVDGRIRDREGDTGRGELYLRHLWRSEDELKLSLYGGEAGLGGGAETRILDSYGSTRFSFAAQKPVWTFIGSVVNGGTQDQLMARRVLTYDTRTRSEIGVSLQRYNLEGLSNAASTVALTGEVFGMNLYSGETSINFSYNLDAEYAIDREEPVDRMGDRYNALPFESREFHVLSIGAAVPVRKLSTFSIFGGYALNRLGPSAPTFGAIYRGRLDRSWEFTAQAGTTFNTSGSGTREDRVVLGITRLFPAGTDK